MSFFKKKAGVVVVLLAVIVGFMVVLSTCGSPLGFGKQIDWEPPELILDGFIRDSGEDWDLVPTPLYVKNGIVLRGRVRDNVGVKKVVLTDNTDDTHEELFTAVIEAEKDQEAWQVWKITLDFDDLFEGGKVQNGDKIMAQISAYDTIGNCGADSIAFVTLIVDLGPPIVEGMTIQRTDSRMAYFTSYSELTELETTDPRGEKKDFLYKYQNGWFYVDGIVDDLETKVKIVALNIYDVTDPEHINTLLKTYPHNPEASSAYFPRWLVKEDDIIDAGEAKWPGYRKGYYEDKKRYYYRVAIQAIDVSDNQSRDVLEEEGSFCMWEISDEPKGILDPSIGAIVSRGTPLPVDFFDDDSLEWAYTGLLTYEQWEGLEAVYLGGVKIPSSYSDAEKLNWLKERLRRGDTVYNWRYHRWGDTTTKDAEILNQIGDKSLDEKLYYIPTGNAEEDYGEFVLFSLAADKKLAPHTGTGPENTNKDRWGGRFLRIQIIDENAPLIVFDTTAGCPEENTFPALAGGEYFDIIGYTLRENQTEKNSVTTFRMAWIPYNLPDGADKAIPAVQRALSNRNFAGMPEGVQYWEFVDHNDLTNNGLPIPPQTGNFVNEGQEPIDTSIYKKQSFRKQFHILGGSDDIKTGTNNFTYNSNLENETKLFIFYAEDNMGHEVFRQLRLLGMKTPPDLAVYDITNKLGNESLGETGKPGGLPDPNEGGNFDQAKQEPTPAYFAALRTVNNDKYAVLKTRSADFIEENRAQPFEIYPMGTILKYWVNAEKSGDIAVATISMKDITFESGQVVVGSDYNETDRALSFCEYFPDVTQRTFLFEATDKLGNIARIQRTIAISSAARLENITTTTQNGTYGINTEIVLKANFSSQIYVVPGGISGTNPELPYLHVRYKVKGVAGYIYDRVPHVGVGQPVKDGLPNYPTKENPSLSLDFSFRIAEDYEGQLETAFQGFAGEGAPNEDYTKPIFPYTAQIMDYLRDDPAFIPGYKIETVTMPNWENNTNTLQKKKEIMLDGVRPVIHTVTLNAVGKTPYLTTKDYYLKTGETLELTLTADKPIRASTNSMLSTLRFYIQDSTGTQWVDQSSFKYQRPGTNSNVLIFSLSASDTAYDGTLNNISLSSAGTIMDDVGNIAGTLILPAITDSGDHYYIKKAIPAPPAATLNGTAFASAPSYYASSPTLTVPNSAATAFAGWEDTKAYSFDGGVNWTTVSSSSSSVTAPVSGGNVRLRARYIDRAGNEGEEASKDIQVNSTFPALVSVNAVQANGYYKAGSNLTFNLNFADTVTVNTPGSVSITVKNRNTSGDDQMLTTNMAANATGTTITFNWPSIAGKEMRDGLYISAVTLTGLRDRFGNTGSTGTAAWSGGAPENISINSCPNLAAGIIVDAIAPTIDTSLADNGRTPKHNTAPSGDASITEIKLRFREPVMKGSGVITIRPHGTYAIPPVLRDTGYYLGTDGNEYKDTATAPTVKKTYISSFYDIYNALTSVTDRTALTQSTNNTMSNLVLNERTGQSAGPYKKMTHGLVSGFGYTGDYSGSNVSTGTHAPNANEFTAMIPDTATKWVLDYQYPITGTTTQVAAIRTALTNAKWRWQEIDVVNTTIGTGSETHIVTITLNEPLLKGLEWDVYYPATAFTDMAGNPAPASGSYTNGATTGTNNDYYFTSPGVQPPVIRVNRRSYDARNSNWASNTNRTYQPPDDTTPWNVSTAVTDSNGWGVGNFNTVHYRVETESSAVTQGASVSVQYFKGAAGNKGGVTAAWSGDVQTTTLNAGASLVGTNVAWTSTATANNTVGTWILSNLIRRASITSQTYTVITKNGTPESRSSQVGNNQNALRMFKSYNRDLKQTQLDGGEGVSLTTPTGTEYANGQGILTFDPLEASKSYIVGSATCNAQTAKGYEGVFRTVIVFNYAGNRGANNYFQVQGSNIKNGMPSIAGFPVRDAEETGDNRFIKVFYAATTDGATALRSYYWVSTEIVCEWYFLNWGGGTTTGFNGTHQDVGEVNNYLMIGYGDLTYAFNIHNSNMGNIAN